MLVYVYMGTDALITNAWDTDAIILLLNKRTCHLVSNEYPRKSIEKLFGYVIDEGGGRAEI